ncbi:MAG: putative cytochrome c [Herbaspirillum sp.]|jgi:cytochrome c553|nr:putative cytochrome c [Herbaspirillum sp.]
MSPPTTHSKNNGRMMKKIITLVAVLGAASISFAAHAAGDIEAGKTAVAKYNCATCHGADFNSPIDPTYPKLAGQHHDYLQHALIAYKRGNAAGVMNGRSNPIMGPQVAPLSEQDIINIAAYLSSLPGSLVVSK